MSNQKIERKKYLKRIAQFKEELAEQVRFELVKDEDGEGVKVERRHDPERFCILPAREFINDQPEARYKIARITGLAMPPMENDDYHEFVWKVFHIASAVALARKDIAALYDEVDALHLDMQKPK
jgi:hypothetical protein